MNTAITKKHSTIYPDEEHQLSALGVFHMRPVLRLNRINAVKYNPELERLTKKLTHADGFHAVEASYINFYGVAGIELKFTANGQAQTLRPLVVPLYLSEREDTAAHYTFLIHCLNEQLELHHNGNPLPLNPLENKSYRLANIAIDAIATEVQAESEIEYFACNNMMPNGELETLPDYTCLLHKAFEFGDVLTNSFKVIVKDRKLSVLLTTLNEMKTNEFLSTDDPIDAWSFPLPDRLPNFTTNIVLELIKNSTCFEYLTYSWAEDFGDAKIEDLAQAIADKLNLYYNLLNTMKYLYSRH